MNDYLQKKLNKSLNADSTNCRSTGESISLGQGKMNSVSGSKSNKETSSRAVTLLSVVDGGKSSRDSAGQGISLTGEERRPPSASLSGLLTETELRKSPQYQALRAVFCKLETTKKIHLIKNG